MKLHFLPKQRTRLFAIAAALFSTDSLFTLGATSLQLACENGRKACTEAGCTSGVTFHVPVGPALPVAQALTMTLCRDDQCIGGQFSLVAGEPPAAYATFTIRDAALDASDSDRASVTIGQANPQHSSTIEIQFMPFAVADLVDGDRYTITITDAANVALMAKETTVAHYSRNYPNGPDCDPQPCLEADVTL